MSARLGVSARVQRGKLGLWREQPKRAVKARREPGDDDARVPLEPLCPAVHHDLEAGRVGAAIIPVLCNRRCHLMTMLERQAQASSALPLEPSTVTLKPARSGRPVSMYFVTTADVWRMHSAHGEV